MRLTYLHAHRQESIQRLVVGRRLLHLHPGKFGMNLRGDLLSHFPLHCEGSSFRLLNSY